jgi:predicted dehydrogenase
VQTNDADGWYPLEVEAPKRALIVGAGTMGRGYARLLASGRVPGVELAGIVDLIEEKAQNVAAVAGTTAYTDLFEAIKAAEPDLAYVATPDALHRAPVETLATAGVAILVEKPLATTVDDARAMVDVIEQTGVHAEVNFANRWNPPFAEAKRVIDSGEAGEIRSFNVRLNNPISTPETNLTWSATTTPAWFLMSHCLDLAHWLGGKRATSVYATAGHGVLSEMGIATPDWVHAVVHYEGGGDGIFESLWILPDTWPGDIEFRFRATGSRAAVDVDTSYQNIAVTGPTHHHPTTLNWAQQRMTAFLRAMGGQGRTVVGFPDALEVTKILVAIHRSIESGAVEPVED